MKVRELKTVIHAVRTKQALLGLPVMSILDLQELPRPELEQMHGELSKQLERMSKQRQKNGRKKTHHIRQATIRVIRMAQRALSLPVQTEGDLAVKSGPELAALFSRLEKQLQGKQ